MADSASENEETSKKGEKRTQDGYEEDSGSSTDTDAQSVASDESFDEDMVSFFFLCQIKKCVVWTFLMHV